MKKKTCFLLTMPITALLITSCNLLPNMSRPSRSSLEQESSSSELSSNNYTSSNELSSNRRSSSNNNTSSQEIHSSQYYSRPESSSSQRSSSSSENWGPISWIDNSSSEPTPWSSSSSEYNPSSSSSSSSSEPIIENITDDDSYLDYQLSGDGTYYIIAGIIDDSDFYDGKHLIIKAEHNGLPVLEIGQGAFANSKISAMTLPEGITTMGAIAFDESQITSINIPSTLQVVPFNAFAYSRLKYVTIAEGVKKLESQAFIGCPIEEIVLPSTLGEIGTSCFQNCYYLRNVTIQEGVTKINLLAFCRCESLRSIHIPASVTYMRAPFFDCSDNLYVEIDSKNTSIKMEDGAIMTMDGTILIEYMNRDPLNEYVVPSRVATIGGLCFANTSITTVVLPKSVTKIETEAFSYCETEKIIYHGSESSWSNVIAYCGPIEGIEIEFTSTSDDGYLDFQLSNDGTYYIINGILNNSSFYDGKELIINSRHNGLPVKEIAQSAFNKCQIDSIVLPEGITTIGANAFSESKITSINIPSTVEELPFNAFAYSNLNNVTFKRGLKVLGQQAFIGCPLEEITLPNTLEEIGISCFQNCYHLSSISLPNSIKRINTLAFCRCESLRSIQIPASVEYMRASFFDCSNKLSVEIDSGNTNIKMKDGNIVSYDETVLIEVLNRNTINEYVVDENVTTIGIYCFSGTKMNTVVLPSTLERIETAAFSSSGTKKIIFLGNEDQWNNVIAYCGPLDNIEVVFGGN